jgi:hypothetical protein
MEDQFNVVQFFEDGQYEYVRRAVPALDAVRAVQHYTTSVGARMGTTVRVIITDMMDCTCFEWHKGKITFPTQTMMDEVSDQLEKSDAQPAKD